ncbi:MAG TPA: hypothetical protein VGZ29_04405 [Terriglobia bacterium]|nr:hypothetical protein [Terriglobia bacterium]
MSLLKRLSFTPKKHEANQPNAQLSQGPATVEGIERIRVERLLVPFAETAAFRQVKQITEMLTQFRQIRRQGQGNSEKRQAEEAPEIKNDGKSHDVVDNKGPSSEAVDKSHDILENREHSCFWYDFGGRRAEVETGEPGNGQPVLKSRIPEEN